MKKISQARRIWSTRRARKIFKRIYWRKRKSIKANKESRLSTSFKRPPFVSVYMPSVISIGRDQERTSFLEALDALRVLACKDEKNIVLDFSATRHIAADGMLLLYAELLRLKRHLGSKISVRCRLPENSVSRKNKFLDSDAVKVAEVLKHVGILDLLGNSSKIMPSREDVIHWKIAHGSKSQGSKTEPLLKVVDDLLGKMVSRKFYTGLTEAMTNSYHHAYSDIREDGLNIENDGGWWMFSQVKDKVLSILICDLGIGIPRSLPRTNNSWIMQLEKRRFIQADSLAIEYATRHGSTSTDLLNRGKGLKKMVQLVKDVPNSSLVIYSNSGAFYSGKSREIGGFVQKDFKKSILGTLVYWQVELRDTGVA